MSQLNVVVHHHHYPDLWAAQLSRQTIATEYLESVAVVQGVVDDSVAVVQDVVDGSVAVVQGVLDGENAESVAVVQAVLDEPAVDDAETIAVVGACTSLRLVQK